MRTALVVPCYNEEHRLDGARFASLARESGVDLLFVNDGSTDRTGEVLERLAHEIGASASVLTLERNSGKGEAVRRGLLAAMANGAEIVGYADADLATPPREIVRLRDALVEHGAEVVTGARVALLGRSISRSTRRHYVGRVFATVASLLLRAPYYDTQCGAKFFRSSALLRAALEQKFVSRWAFDVELIGRLLIGTGELPPLRESDFLELPLWEWTDMSGSKLTAAGMLRSGIDLGLVGIEFASWRRNAARRGSRA